MGESEIRRMPHFLHRHIIKWDEELLTRISPIPPLSTLTSRATHAHPTSPRSTGFCAIWGCISSSSTRIFRIMKLCKANAQLHRFAARNRQRSLTGFAIARMPVSSHVA